MPSKTDAHAVTCPTCGTKYRSVNIAARRVQCGRCGTIFYDWYKPLLIGQGYDDFLSFKGRYCVCKGGRGSKKSKTAAIWHIMNMMKYPEANTLVIRKTERTLKDSCFSDLRWAIHRLGCDNEWKCTTNPLEITRLSTGQKILFRGFDDPLKITSISVPIGYLCWVWIEEAYEITNETDFNKLDMSIRGEMPPGYFKRFTITFNPWNEKIWLKHRFFDVPDDMDKLTKTTDYRCNEWLDDSDRRMFERMKRDNPTRYNCEGLGGWGISEGLVYTNWQEFAFDIDAVKRIEGIKPGFGLDLGWTDPAALVGLFIDEAEKRIYVFDELYKQHLTNPEIAQRIISMGYRKEKIYVDSAEPKSIQELANNGLSYVEGVKKGEIINGIKKVNEYRIIIHPRCVSFLTEISNYSWEKDKFGNTTEKPVHEFSHAMDAMRYAVTSVASGDCWSFE